MKQKIKSYIESLKPKQLGLKREIKFESIKKLGQGTGNLNYLINVTERKFVFRMNMEPGFKEKSRKEYGALKIVEKTGIAPKVFVLDDSRKVFDSDFIVLEYLEGKTVNKTSDYYKPKMFREIGKLLAKLHSIPVKGKIRELKKESRQGFSEFMEFLRKNYIDYIRKSVKNKDVLKMLDESYKNLENNLPKSYREKIVVSQGDFCEQNIIVNNGKYRLIDFEDLELSDAPTEIAQTFVTFGKPFDEKQKKLFFEAYYHNLKVKIKNSEQFEKDVENWIRPMFFNVFLWSVKHVLRIKNREMHSKFIQNNDIEKDVSYMKTMLKRCIRFGVIDEKWKNLKIEELK